MKIISHRANINGVDQTRENVSKSIKECFLFGFDVEIDLWWHKNNFYLGHDYPKQKLTTDFLKQYKENLWIHAKNLEVLCELSIIGDLNYFWHQNDDYTLTSKGFIWAFPGKKTNRNVVIVNNNFANIDKNCYGICTDYPLLMKQKYDLCI